MTFLEIYKKLTEEDVLKLSSAYGRLMDAAYQFTEHAADEPQKEKLPGKK